MKLINKTLNGQLFFCQCCNIYQLEFGNMLFSLNEKDFFALKSHIAKMEGDSLLRDNIHLSLNRKILLSLPSKNTLFCLTVDELEELKTLLFVQKIVFKDCSTSLLQMEIFLN